MISTTAIDVSLLPTQEGRLPPIFERGGYYRSKLFNTAIGVNPLIAAASPLFSLALFLKETSSISEEAMYKLYQNLQHEIKAFETNAKIQRYHSETILVARFLICAFLDEIILNIKEKEINEEKAFSLLFYFHQEQEGDERFFVILEKLSQDPELHGDLLEFIYLCLSFGYRGKYKTLPQGKEIIEQMMHKLFGSIHLQREELKKEVYIPPAEKNLPVPVAKTSFPLGLLISFILVLLLTLYSGFDYLSGSHTRELYQQVHTLLQQTKNEFS